jgi:hypothetical protein
MGESGDTAMRRGLCQRPPAAGIPLFRKNFFILLS